MTSLKAARLEVFDGPVAGQVLMTGLNEAFKPRIVFPQVAEPLETLGVTPLYFGVLVRAGAKEGSVLRQPNLR